MKVHKKLNFITTNPFLWHPTKKKNSTLVNVFNTCIDKGKTNLIFCTKFLKTKTKIFNCDYHAYKTIYIEFLSKNLEIISLKKHVQKTQKK